MAKVNFANLTGSIILNPPSGSTTLFVNLDGIPCVKYNNGTIVELISSGAFYSNCIKNTYVAGATVLKHRVVMLSGSKVIHFDPTNENNTRYHIGITDNEAIVNLPVDVISEGRIVSSSWGLSPDTIYYAGASGSITSILPTGSGIFMEVGLAISAEEMYVKLSEPIITI